MGYIICGFKNVINCFFFFWSVCVIYLLLCQFIQVMHKNIGKCIGGFPLYSIIREASDWSQIHASVNLPSQCQTVGVVKRYLQPLEELGVLQQMVWSPQTLDHHIMETDWDYMNVKKQSRQPKSTEESWWAHQDARMCWCKVNLRILKKV